MTFKLTMNLSILKDALQSPDFVLLNSYIKIGIYNYESLRNRIIYLLPEILLIALFMLNEIHLRLLGLYYKVE